MSGQTSHNLFHHAVTLLSVAAMVLVLTISLTDPSFATYTKTWTSYQDFGQGTGYQPELIGTERTPSGSVILEQVEGDFLSSGTIRLNFNAGTAAKFKELDLTNVINEGSTSVKARVKTAMSESALSSAAFSSYYDSFPATLTVSNGIWIQVELLLETSNPSETPVVQEGELSYLSEKDDDPRRKFFPAPSPTNQKIKLTSDGKPHITWKRATGKDAEHVFNYIILKGFENYPVYGHPIAILSRNASSFIDHDVDPETTYRYYIRARGEFNQTDNNKELLEVTTPKAKPQAKLAPPPLRLSADIKPIELKIFSQLSKRASTLIEAESKSIFDDYHEKFQASTLNERIHGIQKDPASSEKLLNILKSKLVRGNKNRYARLEIWHNGKGLSLIESKVLRINELGVAETKLYLKPGIYKVALYIPGSLRLVKDQVTFTEGNVEINFAEGPKPYFTLGDFTGDGKINSLDFSHLAKNWSTNEQSADLNSDGLINALDFAVLYKNWNQSDNFTQ